MNMNIYHYDKDTKEFTFSMMADKDPEETRLKGEFVPLIPAYATSIEPPELKENEAAVFDVENNKWVIKPDYRKNFKLVTAEFNIQNITKIGEIKDGFVVSNDIAELIKQNPQHFKIKNNEVVKKTELEIETETKEAERQVKIAEIKAKLEEIDISSQRSSRAISLCILNEETPNPEDIEKLMDYENKAGELREELQELENIQNESEGINE